jgi:hypothetical protein
VILGRFYTPRGLADEVVRRALGPLKGRERLKILDPACGEGVFLAAARDFLGADHEFVGVDVDAAALARVPEGVETRHADALACDWGDETFHAVIGNPPWVSFSGRHAAPLDAARRAVLEEYETFRGWPSLHAPFVELSVRLATERVALLLPAQVCELDGYAPLRAHARKRGSLAVSQFGEDAFAGVTQPTCAWIIERGAVTDDTRAEDPFGHCPRPPAGAFGDIGVHTGNCARKLLDRGSAPVREGRDIAAFSCATPRRTLDASRAKQPGEYYRVGSLERYRSVPILLRQTAARPIAALHTDPTYFRNSVLACFGLDGVDDARVVAWLNSTPIGWYHRTRIAESNQRTFPQVKLRHLRDLPLPDWDAVVPGKDVPWQAFGLARRP